LKNGFIMVEVVVSIAVMALILSLVYQLFVTLDLLHTENKVILRILEILEREAEEWRNLSEKGDRTFSVEQIEVTEEVEVTRIDKMMEKGVFYYSWSIGNKFFQLKTEIDRFNPLKVEEVGK
jgi:type II secretory pathway pseudopilin PulG